MVRYTTRRRRYGAKRRYLSLSRKRLRLAPGYTRTGGEYFRTTYGHAQTRRRRLTSMLRNYSPAEIKDVTFTGSVITSPSSAWIVPNTAGTGGLILGVTQGPGNAQRIGRRIQIKSIYIKGIVGMTGGAWSVDTFCWKVLFA